MQRQADSNTWRNAQSALLATTTVQTIYHPFKQNYMRVAASMMVQKQQPATTSNQNYLQRYFTVMRTSIQQQGAYRALFSNLLPTLLNGVPLTCCRLIFKDELHKALLRHQQHTWQFSQKQHQVYIAASLVAAFCSTLLVQIAHFSLAMFPWRNFARFSRPRIVYWTLYMGLYNAPQDATLVQMLAYAQACHMVAALLSQPFVHISSVQAMDKTVSFWQAASKVQQSNKLFFGAASKMARGYGAAALLSMYDYLKKM